MRVGRGVRISQPGSAPIDDRGAAQGRPRDIRDRVLVLCSIEATRRARPIESRWSARRGLDREQRRSLLKRARIFWQDATLVCITHDVGETLDFERVIVVEGGHIVEDGIPTDLVSQTDSRYHSMLDAEESVRSGMWGSAPWRRLRIDDGKLTEANN